MVCLLEILCWSVDSRDFGLAFNNCTDVLREGNWSGARVCVESRLSTGATVGAVLGSMSAGSVGERGNSKWGVADGSAGITILGRNIKDCGDCALKSRWPVPSGDAMIWNEAEDFETGGEDACGSTGG